MGTPPCRRGDKLKIVILYNLDERLISGEYGEALAELSLKEEIDIVEESCDKLGYDHRTVSIQDGMPILSVANLLHALKPDCVFNLVEAINGNFQMEMALPAMLDLMGVPYTGSNALTLGLCQDKSKSKAIMAFDGILTPLEYAEWHEVDYPVIVKPLMEDGSLGINRNSVVYNDGELFRASEYVRENYKQEPLVEEYIEGREFGIGVIDFNGGPKPFPVSEIVFDGYPDGIPKIVSYSAKWDNESIEYKNSVPRCPAGIDQRLAKRLQDTGLKVFKLFGCKGYARVDVRVRDNKIYVIEVNPNCDIAPGSGIFTILNAAGISYEEFIKNLVEGALRGK